jgi:hypothetical protein
MKHFLIRYTFSQGTREAWHAEITRFITALENDPKLRGRISYRCMKVRDTDDYYHVAAAADDRAPADLNAADFFKRYTEASDAVSAGGLEVLPLEIIAETSFRA